jgi:hypothetical protein
MSRSGSHVAYWVRSQEVHVIPTAGGLSMRVSASSGEPCDWSLDEEKLLCLSWEGGPAVLDIPSGQSRSLLSEQEHVFFQLQFSPDNRWVAFVTHRVGQGERRQIFVAPYRDEGQIPKSDWIAITDGRHRVGTPRWSPDGNLLYLQSERDGFLCIWAYPLDPVTKRPRGQEKAVYHFHEARLSPSNVDNTGVVGLAVAQDKIVLTLGELTGNIWLMRQRVEN